MISETRPALRRVRQTPRAPGRLQRAHRTVSSVIKYDPRGCACRRSSASAWPPRLGLPRVLGRSIRTTAVKRVCRGYFPLIHIVFSDPLASERFPRVLGGEGGLKTQLASCVWRAKPNHILSSVSYTIEREREREREKRRKQMGISRHERGN